MKMTILGLEYINIRKIPKLTLSFVDPNEKIIKYNFIMMANGTGKTTTMELIKGLLDGSAENWDAENVKKYAPQNDSIDNGSFSITVKFDDRQYKYLLNLNYKNGTASIKTVTTLHGGLEVGRLLPVSLKDIFNTEFVRRFIFDGEQAEKTMDSSSNEAEETIRYLYRLDELDDIIAANESILLEIQTAEKHKGSDASLSKLQTQLKKCSSTISELTKRGNELRNDIEKFESEKEDLIIQRDILDKNFDNLNNEKQSINLLLQSNRDDIDLITSRITNISKSPYLISNEFCNRMHGLGNSMTKLKLPKTISKDFFVELSNSKDCICGRCIGKDEKKTILDNANKYLGSDQQSILNAIKSSLLNCKYDTSLTDAFSELYKLREEKNRLSTQQHVNEENLLKAGGKEAEELKRKIDGLNEKIGAYKYQLNIIESNDVNGENITDKTNINKARITAKECEQKIASVTRTNTALHKKKIVENLVNKIKEQATFELKNEIIRKANEKIKKIITDDNIEIESIDRYIKLKGRSGASEGQTLGIAYAFIGTLFEDSELEFPFVIDSPTGKMDFEKREAVAEIIPKVFNQLIAFVQSAEVERFADRFYDKPDTQYLTIIASPDNNKIEIHKGIEYFDSYQREQEGGDE